MENNSLEKINETITSNIGLLLQARSNFQLEHFVINQHDTNEMRYKQCLLEMQTLYYTIKVIELEVKKTEIEIKDLLATDDEKNKIDAEIKQIRLEQTNFALIGAMGELDKLIEIYNSFEHKYTSEEIEKNQLEYWDKRLRRQALLEEVGGRPSQASNLEALRQMGSITLNPNKNEITINPLELE